MKTTLKYIGYCLAGIIALLLCFVIFLEIRGVPSYTVETERFKDYKVIPTVERLDRGRKLTSMLCANCHHDANTGQLTGEQMLDAPVEFGKIYSQNITADKEFGIGDWTDGELLYLLRTGIKRDGQYSPPYMAKLPHMSDEDIASIITYLRSGEPAVAASNTIDQACQPTLLTKFLCLVAFKPMKFPEAPIANPDTANQVALGKYLAINLECFSCHSADFKTNNFEEPELSVGYFGGGNQPLDREGHVMYTPNISPDPTTGIGNWTEAKFIKALKYGVIDGQDALRYPMVPFAQVTDKEAGAIYAYLRSIPAISNEVKRAEF